jgi:putative transposase
MSTSRDPLYRRHRFPPEVISYAVWLYFRFPLSLRMVEEMLAARGICGTNETVREWGRSRQGVLRSDPPARACSRRQMAYGWGGSSRLLASRTGCGAPSIKMASFSTSWSSVEETVALRSGS